MPRMYCEREMQPGRTTRCVSTALCCGVRATRKRFVSTAASASDPTSVPRIALGLMLVWGIRYHDMRVRQCRVSHTRVLITWLTWHVTEELRVLRCFLHPPRTKKVSTHNWYHAAQVT
eukprot:1727679-Rhodomonas_salina.2